MLTRFFAFHLFCLGPALEKAKEKKPVPTEGDKDQNPEHVDRQTKLRFQPAKKARKE